MGERKPHHDLVLVMSAVALLLVSGCIQASQAPQEVPLRDWTALESIRYRHTDGTNYYANVSGSQAVTWADGQVRDAALVLETFHRGDQKVTFRTWIDLATGTPVQWESCLTGEEPWSRDCDALNWVVFGSVNGTAFLGAPLLGGLADGQPEHAAGLDVRIDSAGASALRVKPTIPPPAHLLKTAMDCAFPFDEVTVSTESGLVTKCTNAAGTWSLVAAQWGEEVVRTKITWAAPWKAPRDQFSLPSEERELVLGLGEAIEAAKAAPAGPQLEWTASYLLFASYSWDTPTPWRTSCEPMAACGASWRLQMSDGNQQAEFVVHGVRFGAASMPFYVVETVSIGPTESVRPAEWIESTSLTEAMSVIEAVLARHSTTATHYTVMPWISEAAPGVSLEVYAYWHDVCLGCPKVHYDLGGPGLNLVHVGDRLRTPL